MTTLLRRCLAVVLRYDVKRPYELALMLDGQAMRLAKISISLCGYAHHCVLCVVCARYIAGMAMIGLMRLREAGQRVLSWCGWHGDMVATIPARCYT